MVSPVLYALTLAAAGTVTIATVPTIARRDLGAAAGTVALGVACYALAVVSLL